ncbi:MAG: L-ornithine N(5)-monooxygenase [Holosporales bacterium]
MNETFDIIGIGFGPSNMAVAACLKEEKKYLKALFLDKKKQFDWHAGMIIPNGHLQVPFFRDLATLRDPKSDFTFLNYLKEKNRLDKFINLRTFYPSRIEYQDYLLWANHKLKNFVCYEKKVESVSFVDDQQYLRIQGTDSSNNSVFDYKSKNVVLSTGRLPYIPDCAKNLNCDRIFHTAHFTDNIHKQYPNPLGKYRFVVVGSGQSAAEVMLYLIKNYPNATLMLCFKKVALQGCDSNPFINEMYHNKMISSFYRYDDSLKEYILKELKHSNYSVIDSSLLNEFYDHIYQNAFQDKNQITVKPLVTLQNITIHDDMIFGHFFNKCNQKIEEIETDGIILATGYVNNSYEKLLKDVTSFFEKDSNGNFIIEENYQIKKKDNFSASIFVHGLNEKSHGISDQTLSVLSTRSSLIVNQMAELL